MLKRNENGRSMVEMLGVLAIIGVLSIGGIAGYTIAMRRWKANDIINTGSMLAVLAMEQNAKGEGSYLAASDAGVNAKYVGSAEVQDDGVYVYFTGESGDTALTDTIKSIVGEDRYDDGGPYIIYDMN